MTRQARPKAKPSPKPKAGHSPRPKAGHSKDETYQRVFRAVLELEASKGRLNWTMAALSRASGVSRTLIYYYFGSRKEDILLHAVRVFGELVTGATPERLRLWNEGRFADTLALARGSLAGVPGMPGLYFSYRDRDDEIGDAIRKLEADHVTLMGERFPGATLAAREAFSAMFFGFVFLPTLSPEGLREGIRIVMDIAGQARGS